MPWMKYLKASVSLAGCKKKTQDITYQVKNMLNSFAALNNGAHWGPHVEAQGIRFSFDT